jgi:hypothetical protein
VNDQLWQAIRYVLIAGGMFLAGRSGGKISVTDVMSMVDQVLQVGGAVVSVGTMAWGFYVKYKTATVPIATAKRSDVPTVDQATGTVVH